jgi:hypothetical protein
MGLATHQYGCERKSIDFIGSGDCWPEQKSGAALAPLMIFEKGSFTTLDTVARSQGQKCGLKYDMWTFREPTRILGLNAKGKIVRFCSAIGLHPGLWAISSTFWRYTLAAGIGTCG